MKKYTLVVASLFLAIGLMLPTTTQAQTDVRLGPRIGADFGDVEEAFIGIDGRIDTATLPVTINPTLDVYFGDSDLWSLSGNSLYTFGVTNQVFDPYAGGGLGIYSTDNSTDLGLNFLFGAEFSVGSLRPFVEAQVTPVFDDFTLFNLKGGLLFSL